MLCVWSLIVCLLVCLFHCITNCRLTTRSTLPPTPTPKNAPSVKCDLLTLVRLATGRLSPAAALLTGAVGLRGDRMALKPLATPMAAAGKAVAAEFPQLFADVKGQRRGRKGREALLLPEGAL